MTDAFIHDRLASAIAPNEQFAGSDIRQAEVTAIDWPSFTLSCKIDGSSTSVSGIPFLNSFFPVVGNHVWLYKINEASFLGFGSAQGNGWSVPTFTSPWANYDNAGTWQVARYRWEGANVIRIEGLVKTTANITPIASIFTIPVGYRPPQNLITAQWGSGIGAESAARVTVIGSSGSVELVSIYNSAAPYTVGFLSINITYSTI